jgi:CheY-like chemotaxis protein
LSLFSAPKAPVKAQEWGSMLAGVLLKSWVVKSGLKAVSEKAVSFSSHCRCADCREKNNMEKTRILLVDDEDAFRISLGKRLASRDLDILQAASGEECLNLLGKETVDVVILDVKMPGMDGIETLHHIKRNHASTEVIMLTGHATTQDGIEGIRSGGL